MTIPYLWLKFFHLLGLSLFLFGHGVAAGASLGLRARPSQETSRVLLRLSIESSKVAYPGLILLLGTGIWMGFSGSWWGHAWIWVAIAVLVATLVAMTMVAVPYHRAREADGTKVPKDELEQRLARTRPVAGLVVGSVGLLVLLFLMVLKPF